MTLARRLLAFALISSLAVNSVAAQVCVEKVEEVSSGKTKSLMSVVSERTKETMAIDLNDAQTQETRSYTKYQKIAERLSKKDRPLKLKELRSLVDVLYNIGNETKQSNISAKNFDTTNKILKGVHEAFFKKIMDTDLRTALREAGYQEPTPNFISRFLHVNLPRLHYAVWAAVNIPYMLLSRTIIPMSMPRIPQVAISPETEELVRSKLLDGDFNGALIATAPDLQKAYGNRVKFRRAWHYTNVIYTTITFMTFANFVMMSREAEIIMPTVAQRYQEAILPMINASERIFSDRVQLEAVVLEKVIETKEDIVHHKIVEGTPEYNETRENVRRMTYDEVEVMYKSLEHQGQS